MNDSMLKIINTFRHDARHYRYYSWYFRSDKSPFAQCGNRGGPCRRRGSRIAVVADEISKLADQTSSSIKEIDSLIKVNDGEIDRGTSNIREAVGLIISKIIEGVNSINTMIVRVQASMKSQLDTGELVHQDAREIKLKSEEIKNATEYHKGAILEITNTISSINQLTQSLAASYEEITANSKETAGIAESLNKIVDFFKIS